MGRIRLDSINDFAQHGYGIRITCGACKKATDRDAVEFMLLLHKRRSSLAIDQLEHRMKCSACGARNAVIRPSFNEG